MIIAHTKVARQKVINPLPPLGPVVVGGVGGSGTRVVAKMLIDMDLYVGSDLNASCDNLWFTLLLCRPKWFVNRASKDKRTVFQGLRILTKAMSGSFCPLPGEWSFILRAIVEWARFRAPGQGRIRRLKKALGWVGRMIGPGQVDPSRHVGWGWKEPNSHIYLDYLAQYFADLRYIHVIRHGLDMAYSRNSRQLYNWGPFLGVECPRSEPARPRAKLSYWVKANRRAIALGQQIGPQKFLLVDFDKLCALPRTETRKMTAFLGLDTQAVGIDRVCAIPQAPTSSGRYRKHDLNVFSQADIDAVRGLGFEVEGW